MTAPKVASFEAYASRELAAAKRWICSLLACCPVRFHPDCPVHGKKPPRYRLSESSPITTRAVLPPHARGPATLCVCTTRVPECGCPIHDPEELEAWRRGASR